jgi:hypothetical protein
LRSLRMSSPVRVNGCDLCQIDSLQLQEISAKYPKTVKGAPIS